MVRLENKSVVSVDGRRPLTNAIRGQGMPIPRSISQIGEAIGIVKKGNPHLKPGPATTKGTLPRLVRRALSLEPLGSPRDLDVSLQDAQFINPWGYNTAMAC